MKSRNVLIIFLAAALLGVTALCGLTAYGTYRFLEANRASVRFFDFANVSAVVTETQTFQVAQPLALEVDTDLGNVSVTAHESDDVIVEISKTGWGRNEEEATAAAEAVSVDVQQTSGGLKLSYRLTDLPDLVFVGSVRPDRVSFNILAPSQADVTLKTRNGEILLSGTTGTASLESHFGAVTVDGLNGALTIQSSNASLVVNGVQAGEEDILLDTNFGSIDVEELAGRTIRLATANGDVSASRVEAAGALLVNDQFGRIEIEEFSAGGLEISNQNGEVQVRSGRVEADLEAVSSFGNLGIEQVEASGYTLETSNGSLRLNGARGRMNLTNRFGEIVVEDAAEAVLTLKSQNGKVIFTGRLDETAAHLIETSFGDIELTIPADSALDLSLETSFGKIQSDLPVTFSGEMSETHWQATLNGGGPELRAVTQNGNISILAQED